MPDDTQPFDVNGPAFRLGAQAAERGVPKSYIDAASPHLFSDLEKAQWRAGWAYGRRAVPGLLTKAAYDPSLSLRDKGLLLVLSVRAAAADGEVEFDELTTHSLAASLGIDPQVDLRPAVIRLAAGNYLVVNNQARRCWLSIGAW